MKVEPSQPQIALLFPVIAWYDIITLIAYKIAQSLLFPVIAWYDIIQIN